MTYYTTDEAGRITAFADFKFLADEIDPETGEILTPAPLLETDREIVRGRDNRLYFAGEEPEPSPEEVRAALLEAITAAIQARLDDFARTRNYDGILSAASYATSANPKFGAEGQYAVEARDATWARAYEILAEVETGQRPMPESAEDVLAELPELIWPPES